MSWNTPWKYYFPPIHRDSDFDNYYWYWALQYSSLFWLILFLMTISFSKFTVCPWPCSKSLVQTAMTMWAVSHRLIPNFFEVITEFLACQIMSPFPVLFSSIYILHTIFSCDKYKVSNFLNCSFKYDFSWNTCLPFWE